MLRPNFHPAGRSPVLFEEKANALRSRGSACQWHASRTDRSGSGDFLPEDGLTSFGHLLRLRSVGLQIFGSFPAAQGFPSRGSLSKRSLHSVQRSSPQVTDEVAKRCSNEVRPSSARILPLGCKRGSFPPHPADSAGICFPSPLKGKAKSNICKERSVPFGTI